MLSGMDSHGVFNRIAAFNKATAELFLGADPIEEGQVDFCNFL